MLVNHVHFELLLMRIKPLHFIHFHCRLLTCVSNCPQSFVLQLLQVLFLVFGEVPQIPQQECLHCSKNLNIFVA